MREHAFSIKEISEWPAPNGKVQLPNVQRGFVWKPWQIEDLWDSLLRKYPVGVFILSPTKNDSNKFEMLDGQQRASAICLGFGTQIFRNREANDVGKVFIDLDYPGENDKWQYLIRVITKWHPWGYQRQDNTKTLTKERIYRALDEFEINDHLDKPLDIFYPVDATLPIPLSYFMHAKSFHDLISSVTSWEKWELLKSKWFKKIKEGKVANKTLAENEKKKIYLDNEQKITARLKEIYDIVKIVLDDENGIRVPVSYFDFEDLKAQQRVNLNNDTEIKTSNHLQPENDLEEEDELENLFVRLNAGGTVLRGEDLTYSILKAHIPPELQHKIEKHAPPLFKPARFITIAYRLFQHDVKSSAGLQRDSLNMRIKPREFQKMVNSKEKLDEFSKYIESLLTPETGTLQLLDSCYTLLVYKEGQNEFGLPFYIITRLSERAPELMFVILYRLKIKGDKIKQGTHLHRKVLGVITLCYWLGKGEKLKDYSKLLSNIWPAVLTFDSENMFWSSATIQRAMLRKVMIRFPENNGGENDKVNINYLTTISLRGKKDIFERIDDETYYGSFFKMMLKNNDLVLFAQRNFLSDVFRDIEYDADDTNLPFDWDHIAPQNLLTRSNKINKHVKRIYSTIGNYRAWPFGLNRMDRDKAPSIKLRPVEKLKYEFKEHEDARMSAFHRFFQRMQLQFKKHNDYSFLDWSACSADWLDLKDDDDLKVQAIGKKYFSIILQRSFELIKTWYDAHLISELLPVEKPDFSSIFSATRWDFNPNHNKVINDEMDYENFNLYLLKRPFTTKYGEVYLYFSYPKVDDDLLNNDRMEFGVWQIGANSFVKGLKIPDDFKSTYYLEDGYVCTYNTLVSFHKESYAKLFAEFLTWLSDFPENSIRIEKENFLDSLKANFRNLIKQAFNQLQEKKKLYRTT
jgi:hypothetical protein